MPIINGTSGDDTLNGTGEADEIYGFEGRDEIYGGDGDDIIDGGADDDWLYGGNGNDEIYGGRAHFIGNFIYDGPGDDTVYGGPDSDFIIGSPGDDFYDGGDAVFGDVVIYRDALAGIVVDLSASSDHVRSSGDGDAANVGIDTLVNIESVSGSNFDDTMIAAASGSTLSGLDGNDVLTGGDGATHLSAATAMTSWMAVLARMRLGSTTLRGFTSPSRSPVRRIPATASTR